MPCLWPTETSCSMSIIDAVAARVAGARYALQRASARKHLPSSVRGLEARLEVSWFVFADGGSRSAWPGWRRWCAPCPLTCPRKSPRPRLDRPSRLGREPLRTQPGRLRPGDDGRGCGARSSPVLGLAPARGTAHTAPGGLDPRLWGLDDGRALAPVAAAAVAWQPQPRAAAAPFRVGVRAWVSAVDGLLTGGYRSSPRVSV